MSGISHSTSITSVDYIAGGGGRLKRNSTWWNRLGSKIPVGGEVPSATSLVRIRDPAEAPVLGNLSLEKSSSADPFHDENGVGLDGGDGRKETRADEQGRLPTTRNRRGRGDYSQSSTGTMDTVSSSILEERMKGMDVVQRVQTGSQNGSEVSFASPVQRHEFVRMPEEDGEEEKEVEKLVGGARSASPDPFVDPPPPPAQNQTPTKPPLLPNSPASGVKALIHRIETQKINPPTPPRPPPPAAPSPSIPKSTSFPNVRKATMEFERPLVPSSSTPRIQHGLVKKPRLFVANPDGSEG
ncbi:hypothetical protein P7C70_g8699, partial [Phenoliferia sp. Uapishka_3]